MIVARCAFGLSFDVLEQVVPDTSRRTSAACRGRREWRGRKRLSRRARWPRRSVRADASASSARRRRTAARRRWTAPAAAARASTSDRIRFQLVPRDRLADANDVLIDDPPRPDIEMPHLGVPHLIARQPDRAPRGFERRPRRLAEQPIEARRVRLRDRVDSDSLRQPKPSSTMRMRKGRSGMMRAGVGCRESGVGEASESRFRRSDPRGATISNARTHVGCRLATSQPTSRLRPTTRDPATLLHFRH